MENFDLVQRAYSELVNSGEIYATSDPQSIENQKAYLTRRAAYYLNLVDNNIGLLSKTSGNNVMGLSTDIVIKHNGDSYDIATDSAGLVRPVNSGVVNDLTLVSRWVQPTKEMAGLTTPIPTPVPTPIPIPTPTPVPSDDYQKILDRLIAISNNQVELANNVNAIINRLDALNVNQSITFPDYKSSGWLSITLSPVKK